ncbi:putative aspartic-type endopeptidase [Lachnellula hyalina]|uniref:Putative aspartic-type endopeptidase n=1 Tax=Lachnellula hyalina TaxID=1316788 RepID=A0A8H8R709_9HELO|nr:putative aspartic-type endopeptidase [Lachnellula hyalina]TVY29176.1 putative aspartic-type endopeptidase [Lachnellula hyalina]
MLFSSLKAIAIFLLGTEARYIKRSDGLTIRSRYPVAKQPLSDIVAGPVTLPLRKIQSRDSALYSFVTVPNGTTISIDALRGGTEFSAQVVLGDSTVELLVDTGSSDTWAVQTGFTCTDFQTGVPTSEAVCGFGPVYTPSSTFKRIPNETLSIEYGDHETAHGVFGTEKVTVGGITVDQQIAVVTEAMWSGDRVTSGIIGLAYPAITEAFSRNHTRTPYDPIFTSMFKAKLISNNYFSLIIERNISGPAGYLSFGGVPPIAFTQNFTATPIMITTIPGYPKAVDFYTINIDRMQVNGKPIPTSGGSAIEYIIDSGTTLNYIPSSVAKAINAAYEPPAKYSAAGGAYVVPCNAMPPAVSVDIGGTAFPINPLDMIIQMANDTCVSTWNDGGPSISHDLYILGDAFMKNVVSLFDVGAASMQFAGREF